MFLYCIYDRVAGTYSSPLCISNDAVARRHFPVICTSEPQFKMFPDDLELYKIGSFDAATGVVVPLDKPEFLMRFNSEV